MNLILPLILLVVLTVFIGALFDAPWLPTRKKDYDKIAQLANFKKGTTFYDLGSGNASMLFYFSKKYNIHCVGIEISPFWYAYSKIKSLFYSKVEIKYGNLYEQDISQADVIYIFLLSKSYPKVKSKIDKELERGSKIIVSTWPFEEKEPVTKIKEENSAPYYLYQK